MYSSVRCQRLRVGAEIEGERAHHRAAFVRDVPRERIDIRQQAVAQLDVVDQELLHVAVEIPDFLAGAGAVHAEHAG